MLATDPEFLDRRLGNQQFLTHQADLTYFNDLQARVQGLARPGESLVIPEPTEAHAWRRLYALYIALRKRPQHLMGDNATTFHGASDLAWETYIRDLTEIRTLAQADVTGWGLMSDYVGLHKGDLDDPVPPPDHEAHRWGRFPDWQSCATRISMALGQLRNMSPRERAAVPEVVRARRRDRAIEARFMALEQKMLALESRLPSMQEILLKEEESNYGEQYNG
jgi:hypothetical protein